MNTPADSLPVFPPELEREIFETAAERHPETISTLLLVSHCVCEWYACGLPEIRLADIR
jgi:hypothetical protein